jgi:hypothetical protein
MPAWLKANLSLGPSVVQKVVDSQYRYDRWYDKADADVGIGCQIASVVDVSIRIESLNHQLAENVYPMVRRLPMEGWLSRCRRR